MGVVALVAALAVLLVAAVLVVHLQEEEVGQLLDIVAIGQPVIAQDGAVVPEALDDGGGGGHMLLVDLYIFACGRKPMSCFHLVRKAFHIASSAGFER